MPESAGTIAALSHSTSHDEPRATRTVRQGLTGLSGRCAQSETCLTENTMNRNLASTFALTAALAAVSIAPSITRADDITIDPTPFVSRRTRAEVIAELLRPSELRRIGSSEWAVQYNPVPRVKSTYTSEQARAEYRASRDFVSAMNSEDSGSAYFIKSGMPAGNANVMGAPAR
jgi:hypothetical protein